MGLTSGTIAVDVMGSDQGPLEIIEGVKLALEQYPKISALTLVGVQQEIEAALKKCNLEKHPKLSICHASEVVAMDDKPTQSLRKKDSSMMKALDLVKSSECAAMLSCGNTGSLMAGATIKLRPMPGIERPALSTVVPSKDHHFILIDAGANPETTPIQLVHNAILGSNHCKVELGINNPKIGLLTIGTEEGKGTDKIQEAHKYLKALGDLINYNGLIEGFHVFERDVDVVVCDGFVGNILVKTCESLFHILKDLFVKELTANSLRKFGALLSLGAFKSIKHKFNPDRYGAAPLLGIDGIAIKAHGSSNRYLVANALHTAEKMLTRDMNEQIQLDVAKANTIIKSNESNPA